MDLRDFINWLISAKSMNERSARDVVCRLKRAMGVAKCDGFDQQIVTKLEASADFAGFTPCVRSQLRRAITLFTEYAQSEGN